MKYLPFAITAVLTLAAAAQTPEDSPYAGDLCTRSHLLGDPAGGRSALAQRGIRIEGALIADYSIVFDGGADEGASAFRHLVALGIEIDTDLLLQWPGGTFYTSVVNQNGEDGSEEVGDFQAFSNIDEAGFTAVYELWYEQLLLDDRLRIKLGKVDANSEFAYVEHGSEFINSSAGYSPTILVLPTYPDPATSVNIFVYPTSWLYAGIGVYDGAAQEGIVTGRRGPSTFLGEPADLFLISEVGFTYGHTTLPGRIGVGVWHHTGSFDRFDGGTDHHADGFYIVVDQYLYKEDPTTPDDPQGLGLFVQYGYADPHLSEVDHHLGVGAQWTGLIPGRDDDALGLMATCVHFTDEPAAGFRGFTDEFELALELFYKFQITAWCSVKPDLQYIVNPGGGGLADALVGTVRVEMLF